MTQDERWLERYKEVMEENHRNPSKYEDSERGIRNWVRHQQKLLNKGELRPERMVKFKQLLEMGERYRHVNQYMWDFMKEEIQ